VVDALLSWTNAIRIIGGTLAGLLAFDSLLIIMTVIGLKIAMKKEEIEILKLIGASQWYIRKPFILEGGIYGIVGAFFAWLIITILLFIFRPALLSFLGAIPVIHALLINPLSSVTLLSIGGLLVVFCTTGFLLGAIGSLITLARYIKF
jgi:cell division transport system permease protein